RTRRRSTRSSGRTAGTASWGGRTAGTGSSCAGPGAPRRRWRRSSRRPTWPRRTTTAPTEAELFARGHGRGPVHLVRARLDVDLDRDRPAPPRLQADPLEQERGDLAPDRDERHRQEHARQAVELAGGEQEIG